MCAVAMERAGLVGEGFLGGSVGGSGEGGGSAGGGVRGMLRRSGKLIRRVGGVSGRSERRQGAENLATDSASRECIIQLHKDVARLQSNTWQVGVEGMRGMCELPASRSSGVLPLQCFAHVRRVRVRGAERDPQLVFASCRPSSSSSVPIHPIRTCAASFLRARLLGC